MSAGQATLSHHPAPHRGRVSRWSAGFGVIGGPLAWFIQLCAGYALATAPCVTHSLLTTRPALLMLISACVLVALLAFLVSRRDFARTRTEASGGHQELPEVGSGRTRFLALWGMLYGAGFAVVSALTAIALAILPRCVG